MSNNTKAQQRRAKRRQQEDAVLGRILIWLGCAAVVEFFLLLFNRLNPLNPCFELVYWLTILVPMVAVLAAIYYLFQRDFFCSAVICACGIFSLQLYRELIFTHPFRLKCGLVLAFLLLAAAVVLLTLLLLDKAPPALSARLRVLVPKGSTYPLLYATCVVNALLLALAMAFGFVAAYYLVFVLVGWLFILAVYYTVKLM